MSRFVALATVGDAGAAEVVVESLTTLGIESQVARVLAEHPYQRSALEPLRILVPEERFAEANEALAALQLDVDRDFGAQARAETSKEAHQAAADLHERQKRRVSFATLWLAFAVPVPITCLCVGARFAGTFFLGAFIGTLAKLSMFEHGTAPIELLWLLAGAKIGDLVVAMLMARVRSH